jgi:hypothetical protein
MDEKEWMESIRKEQYPWMNDNQFECLNMLCDLFNGHHHVYGYVRASGPNGIVINSQHNMFATFDYDQLTRAVVYAHDRLIRFEIAPSGPGMLKLFFHKRTRREGRMHERHPTIEDAISKIRT